METQSLRYIVNAPSFDPDSGGTIFLHELVHSLNTLGETAFLYPMAPVFRQGIRTRISQWIWPPDYFVNSELNTPVARRSDLRDPWNVVIYPEIVLGNPLKIKNVVRWLLYKPGDQHPFSFTENEMYFRVFEKADIPELTGGAPDLFLWKVNRSYRNEQRCDRSGTAYIVRKGHRKPRIAETETPEAIDIEGMSHEKINDVFNRCEHFYSYDEATMYSQFASLCGCLSIVVPGEHNSRAAWVRHHELGEFGVAYGTDATEIEHARATRDELIALLKAKEAAGVETVKRFISLTRERFEESGC